VPPKRSCSPQSRAEQGLKFKAMYRRLGFGATDVANFLQVTPRTVQLWVSGRVRIPYSAYKLLRVLLHYELPGEAWAGWTLSAGRLYTPEGHELDPRGFTWWSLLCRKAEMFSPLYARCNDLERRLSASGGRAEGPRSAGGAARLPEASRLPQRHRTAKVVSRCHLAPANPVRDVPPPMVITGRPSRHSTR